MHYADRYIIMCCTSLYSFPLSHHTHISPEDGSSRTSSRRVGPIARVRYQADSAHEVGIVCLCCTCHVVFACQHSPSHSLSHSLSNSLPHSLWQFIYVLVCHQCRQATNAVVIHGRGVANAAWQQEDCNCIVCMICQQSEDVHTPHISCNQTNTWLNCRM